MAKQRQGILDTGEMSDNMKGIFWAIVATGLFSLVAALAKVAVTDYHVLQILFFRQIVVFLSALPEIKRSFPQSLKTRHPGIHAMRLVGAFVALSCGIWAVAVLPLTTAVTLTFAKTFIVALIALYALDEAVGPARLGAIIMGFVGVVVVIRPGVDGLFDLNALIPIIGAIGAAVAATAVRKLSQTESTATLLVYQALFVGLMAGLPLFWLWTTPDLFGLAFLLGMGVLATMANWIGVKALRLGEVSVVSNIDYSQLIFAAILGFFLFGEIPDAYTLIGATIIIGSALFILHRERLATRRADKAL